MAVTAKITRKGQVTIPQSIREQLKSEVIEFSIVGKDIFLRPVKSVAGSLNAYAGKKPLSFHEAREDAWDKVVKDQYGKKARRR